MKIEPEGVKIVVLPDKVKDKTEGGIWRPDAVKDSEKFATVKGEVLAIGPAAAVEFDDGELQVGDRITYAKYSGVFIEDGDVEVRIINDEDVLARIS